jgi:hypothetical protein
VKTGNVTFVGLNSTESKLESKKKAYDQICNIEDFTTKITREKFQKTKNNELLPNQLAKAKYCSLWAWIGISFAISWWMMGKNGGQFLSSGVMPAEIPH